MDCKKNHMESRELYLGLLPPSSRLGIIPCFKTLAKARICSLASANLPVPRYKPLKEMNTSLPQHRAQSTAKCGSPAAREHTALSGYREVDLTIPVCCTLTIASFFWNPCPLLISSPINSNPRSHAAL